MLDATQTTLAKVQALGFIVQNPLGGEQDLRKYVHQYLGGTESDWADATNIVLQPEVVSARQVAHAVASKLQADAAEAKLYADSAARMAVPVGAAPVIPTTVTPTTSLIYLDHTEAIKVAYFGTDPETPTYNLQAACRYALLHGLTPDDVANTIARTRTECSALMFPG